MTEIATLPGILKNLQTALSRNITTIIVNIQDMHVMRIVRRGTTIAKKIIQDTP